MKTSHQFDDDKIEPDLFQSRRARRDSETKRDGGIGMELSRGWRWIIRVHPCFNLRSERQLKRVCNRAFAEQL